MFMKINVEPARPLYAPWASHNLQAKAANCQSLTLGTFYFAARKLIYCVISAEFSNAN